MRWDFIKLITKDPDCTDVLTSLVKHIIMGVLIA